ncbi:hypothetical protein NXF25_010271 [Crotalus adamanteus]|uniref:Reverse transcriptase RNase H-like domain-containing protein n=1 Tax=Crotalus adamanteus TaxID=8729 RepID=A0AAW1BID4_CROAD
MLQPCAYTSQKFTTTERGCAIWEKEAFAVKWALVTWQHLLEGSAQPFEVWTDHRNLEALQKPRRLSPKPVCWAQYFAHFLFTLKYVPGGKNFFVDALSRLPQYHSDREEVVQAIIPPCTHRVAHMTAGRSTDVSLPELRDTVSGDKWLQEHPGLLTQREGLAWKGNKLYVPEGLQQTVLQRYHDAVLQRCHDAKPCSRGAMTLGTSDF